LLVAVSAHGFGHIGQTAPVVEELLKRQPNFSVTIRSSAPRFKLVERFGSAVDLKDAETDIGMLQATAVDMLIDETAEAYATFHSDWERKVDKEARALEALAPDLILANIPYLTLAGAARVGIPAVAMCSLNWAEIYRHFFLERRREAPSVVRQMLDAYNGANRFLRVTPSMPMPELSNTRQIGPVAQLGRDRSDEIRMRLGVGSDVRLVLLSLGGMDFPISTNLWPRFEGVRFLVPETWRSSHPETVTIEHLGISFADLMASCDALIAKPGYGSFVEAACTGTPVLYIERENWLEAQYLISWFEKNGRCLQIERSALESGDLETPLLALWSSPPPPLVWPTGINDAADTIEAILS
jgi:hypothetical protein